MDARAAAHRGWTARAVFLHSAAQLCQAHTSEPERDCASLGDTALQALTDRVTRECTGKFHVVCELDSDARGKSLDLVHSESSRKRTRHHEQIPRRIKAHHFRIEVPESYIRTGFRIHVVGRCRCLRRVASDRDVRLELYACRVRDVEDEDSRSTLSAHEQKRLATSCD